MRIIEAQTHVPAPSCMVAGGEFDRHLESNFFLARGRGLTVTRAGKAMILNTRAEAPLQGRA